MRSARTFRRPWHAAIAGVLKELNGEFLLSSRCFFGGGTCIALVGGEFRESRDIDFLVSDRTGFRALREAVRVDSLGAIARGNLTLAREVRSDRDGIRTFVQAGALRIKVELILEGRIDLAGEMSPSLGVPVLSAAHLAAEKILANSDRGVDDATFARDVIDLAFLAAKVGPRPIEDGRALATAAYGAAAMRDLGGALTRLGRRGRLAVCVEALGITDRSTLRRGLAILRRAASA